MRTAPYFFDTFSKNRRPDYPRQRGDLTTSVVIVGGGLVGCACALAFATAGVRAVMIEAERVGAGATAGSPGLLRHDFDASFHATARRHGLRAARHLWQAQRRAALDFASALRRHRIRCDVSRQDLVWMARDDGDGARRLKREWQARRDAGIDASWMTAAALGRATSASSEGGLRVPAEILDPYRAAVGLAAAAAARGATVYERTRVRRLRATRQGVEVSTAAGLVTAEAVVVTGGAHEIPDLKALRRHLRPVQRYGVTTDTLAAGVRRELGTRSLALHDAIVPPHVLRWVKDDRVLFMGAEQAPVGPRLIDRTLVQRAGQLMYELSTIYPAISGVRPAWVWSATDDDTPDGLPLLGRHRNFPHHLFALGHGRHGAAAAWLAARLAVRDYLGEAAKGDDLFGFARVL